MTVERAIRAIEASGFSVDRVSPDFGHPDLELVSEAYFPESSLEASSDPRVMLVGDTDLVPVPDVVAQQVGEAQATLRAVGFAVDHIVDRNGVTATAGTVVSQEPAAGGGLAAGRAVDLVVAAH